MTGAAAAAVPFRRPAEGLASALAQFNRRAEIVWFGFEGGFDGAAAVIRLPRLPAGALGGGGEAALNGGVIAAGFDAAAVLAGLGHYDTDTVVTLNLSVQYWRLARPAPGLCFRAWATRTTRQVCFIDAVLGDGAEACAGCTGMVMPRGG